MQLAELIAEALARVRDVLTTITPFDPAVSRRRFSIGAPDGVAAVILPPLLARLRAGAPGIDVAIRQLLPIQGETDPARAWRSAFEELDTRSVDVAVIPVDDIPARFHRRNLFDEGFVLVVNRDHRAAKGLDLDAYCALPHVVVSSSGDPYGFVDALLADLGRSRRVALTAPNFMFALPLVAGSDMICALPRRFAQLYGPAFGLVAVEPPLTLGTFRLNLSVPGSALSDAGLAWLLEQFS
jgi:DNA-binding transcriptional LysR family regulator